MPDAHRMNVLLVLLLVIAEWIQRSKEHVLDVGRLPVYVRWTVYYGLIFAILWFYQDNREFVYFQF